MPTERLGLRSASTSSTAAMAPLVSAVPRPCRPLAPLNEQMGRRRIAAVRGHRIEVGVHQQAGRFFAESGIDVGMLADGHLIDGARAESRQFARQTVHERPFFPVGILSVERHQLREPIHERHRRGYTMARRLC